ncbi:MAG: SpoIID/LytB domain-containing protein, partial [Actinomycetota bacterium]|nr:SpoIID/LytB domain-containing protein [Actinomycetota bacterium]MDQ6928864.1 SpoIID/LytB domain-containing protein [Actinomycetota bacterium]
AAAAAGTLWAVPSPGGTTLLPARDRRYRGEMEVSASGPGGNLGFVNRVDVEDYLRGMGEVRDPSWPAASLQTQAISARTYALRAVQTGGEICDDDRCQVYVGQTVEYPEMDKAVADTRGQVLEFNGGLATTVYSANAGGTTATPQEAWGGGAAGEPYLRAAPYPTGDPMPWTVEIGFADLATRFGYPGTVTGARVSNTGPSGRALEVTLSGDAGDRPVDGLTFASKLSMRSNLFSFRTAQVDAAPPPPPEGQSLIQELPGGGGPLVEAPAAPLPRSLARVAVTLPPADCMGVTGLLGVFVLLAGFGVYSHRQSRRAARRALFSWR